MPHPPQQPSQALTLEEYAETFQAPVFASDQAQAKIQPRARIPLGTACFAGVAHLLGEIAGGFVIGIALGLLIAMQGGEVGSHMGPQLMAYSSLFGTAAILFFLRHNLDKHGRARARLIGWRSSVDYTVWQCIGIIVLAFLIARLIQLPYGIWLAGEMAPQTGEAGDGDTSSSGPVQAQLVPLLGPIGPVFFIILIQTLLLAPIVEEVIWRGYVQTALVDRLGGLGGIMLTAALFATIHFNWLHWPILFIMALALGYVRRKTGALWPAMLLHGLNNWIFTAAMLAQRG